MYHLATYLPDEYRALIKNEVRRRGVPRHVIAREAFALYFTLLAQQEQGGTENVDPPVREAHKGSSP